MPDEFGAPCRRETHAPTGARGATMPQKKRRAIREGMARSSFIVLFRKVLRGAFTGPSQTGRRRLG
ncbi:hypothetical protein [Dyella sp. 2RAB6]|uniref:hypothetical protein n=1 Tax=Dyella sp. 2RAB6 TaxID=3232992 RepID=UPI003F8E77C8